MPIVYRYTHPEGYYTEALEDYGFLAANSTSEKPIIIKGHWPRWNGAAWLQVEDHRKREVSDTLPPGAEQNATEYWLPGDTWQTPARTMVEIGPLPDGATLKKPEKSAAEIAEERKGEILIRLSAIDEERSRPLSDLALGQSEEFAKKKLLALETEAGLLRVELAGLAA